MAKKTSVSEQEETRRIRIAATANTIASIVNNLVKWIGLCFIIYFGIYKTVHELAGEHTFAKIILTLVGEFKADKYVSGIFGVGGVAYGLKQRNLRRSTVAKYSKRVEDVEKKMDPNRSSSKLTRRGETKRSDKL